MSYINVKADKFDVQTRRKSMALRGNMVLDTKAIGQFLLNGMKLDYFGKDL